MDILDHWLSGAASHHRRTGRPLVSLCYAQSLDGSLTTRRGQPLALSGPESLRLTHQLRAAHDSILVGVGTIIADNPSLTVRLVSGVDPQVVIVDSQLRCPPDAKVLSARQPGAWIAAASPVDPQRQATLELAGARLLVLPADPDGRVSLPVLLKHLGDKGILRLMVEGGSQVISSFLAQDLVDLVAITIAPVFVGGLPAVEKLAEMVAEEELPRLQDIIYERLGDDLIVFGRLKTDG
jgi:3,4-dihydroxy 2-butanone 4-phosphate synthase/GTP cyclohydrolase II